MAMVHTDFRPAIDGYAFVNEWTVDPGERDNVRAIVREVVPAAVAILSPVLVAVSPVAIATLGPALIIAGPFLPILLPYALTQALNALSDAVADGANARCAGMAYSSVDYFQQNWALPRGDSANDEPLHLTEGGTEASDWLRDYIWNRLLDSHRANGATFVAWIAMSKLFGDYGRQWIRDQVRNELQTLRHKIEAGTPWPIGLLGESANPTDSHVVVAIGFEQVGLHHARVEIYDNDLPDELCVLDVDASGSSVYITETNADRSWGGLFCTSYTSVRPRPALAATSALSLSPAAYAGSGGTIEATFSAENMGFHTTLPLHLCVGGDIWAYGEDTSTPLPKVAEGDAIPANLPITFRLSQATTYSLVPKVALWSKTGDGPSYKHLPATDGSDMPPVQIVATPRIAIRATAPGGSSCTPVYTEGATVVFTADISSVVGIGIVGYTWSVSGALTQVSHDYSLTILGLPPSPAAIRIDLTIDLADGTEAYGGESFVTMDRAFSERLTKLCEIAHIIEQVPGVRGPIGPAVDPSPVWFKNPAIRKAVDPRAYVQHIEQALQEMQSLLHDSSTKGR
ncbi:hypothetical protein DIE21_32900 [Burkholderia sp. Bp9140]|uniref:hypothetical protein n=1 Tax=Burkholderia sp. Bp9140 TaxID=2184572 RepID=UPI000F5606C1|nr:hypothetical protein [Burkholderia sp. Bp9140]RQR44748.1 hypothetical protein DIE21_32900 [Burkholderia sp. Bp9140]